MPRAKPRSDRLFFWIVISITLFGFFIFSSASLGLLNRDGANFSHVLIKQLIILIGSLILFLVVSKIDYKYWRKFSPYILGIGVVLTLMVFIPGLGLTSGGARRWLVLGSWAFQPTEFLKFGAIIFLATWFSRSPQLTQSWQYGFTPFLVLMGAIGLILALQPDIDAIFLIFIAGLAMFYAAGAKWKQLGAILLIAIAAFGIIAVNKPYILGRIKTFFNPNQNVLSASYQVNQSLIAVGSGGITGRGFGQSLQKFKYLPEPIGDSVFAVAAEEFGFIGCMVIIGLFLALTLSGLKIATRTTNTFGRLTIVGIVIMFIAGAFSNIASMLALIPLSGTPLIFISHGGTALVMALVQAGIILNISKHPA
jgi:cell division protein FtsW